MPSAEQPIAQLAEAPEPGPRVFRIVGLRRQQHQPDQARRAEIAPANNAGTSASGAPNLVSSPARSTCTSSSGVVAGLAGGRVHPAQQVEAVDRVDGVEAAAALARLVRLQVSDEVPPQAQIRRLLQSSAGLPAPCFRRSRPGPRAAAARTAAGGNVLETATRRIEEGSRPAARAACSRRRRTASRLAAFGRIRRRSLLLHRADELLHFLGVGPARRRSRGSLRTP